MVAFAGNSLLCRAALVGTQIDAATFTTLRIVSGAAILYVICLLRYRSGALGGSWASSLALLGYAAGFSFAYLGLAAGTGALLLFGAVQVTMIAYGLLRDRERIAGMQSVGLVFAFTGLIILILPGLEAPPLGSALLMLFAGVSWGIYSLMGRAGGDPIANTAGNFVRAVPFVVLLSLIFLADAQYDGAGVLLAVASGALASGIGYVIWYLALPMLTAATAATVQLSVPVLAALGGVLFLAEPLTTRMTGASIAILGGIALFIHFKRPQQTS